MGAQLRPHSANQIAALQFRKSECPECEKSALRVLESRKTVDGVRRRYKCDECLYRETRHEIPAAAYEELVDLRRKFKELQSLLGVVSEQKEYRDALEELPCSTCAHMGSHGCGFDYPEANTEGAFGCIQYKKG